MANEEQLTILRQGVDGWNAWQKEHPTIYPDLRKASLYRANLAGANFHVADLQGADLTGANLTEANLIGANCIGATLPYTTCERANFQAARLTGANLEGALLRRANLEGAGLTGANLTRTDLTDANLYGAILAGGNLTNASVGFTRFDNLDLRDVRGLDTVRHTYPSTIGIDTIYRSGGTIPEVFLRGCGVPDTFIEYMHALTVRPIEYYSCFISYSSKDQDCAERLHTDLQHQHVRCWFAPEDLKTGDKFRERIEESIRIYDKLLLILSEHSVASPWVEREVHAALEREDQQNRIILFPIRLDDAVMHSTRQWAAEIRRSRHITDFRQWKDHDAYQKVFGRLLRDLTASERSE
jgi:hypothetical protein